MFIRLTKRLFVKSTNSSYAARRGGGGKHWRGFALVLALHLLVLWGLQNGLAHKVMNLVKKPIDAKLLEEVKPKLPDDAPPPPPPPKAPPPPEYVPPPEVVLPAVVTPNPAPTITQVTREPPKVEAPPPPPTPAPKPNVRVVPGVSASNCSYSDADYPPASRRLEEEGVVVLRLLVGEDGRVLESQVSKSSGSARLDEAARTLALTRCKGRPGTLDGAPAKDWVNLAWRWRIE
jgi:periplasmic protein TonB